MLRRFRFNSHQVTSKKPSPVLRKRPLPALLRTALLSTVLRELATSVNRGVRRGTGSPGALQRVAIGLRRLKGNGADDNLLQKIRNQVKLAP
jgi:hypothetical protein